MIVQVNYEPKHYSLSPPHGEKKTNKESGEFFMSTEHETVTVNQYHRALQRADTAQELYEHMKEKYEEVTKELQQSRHLLDQALEVQAQGPHWQEYVEHDRSIPSHIPLCVVAAGIVQMAIREHHRAGKYVWRVDGGPVLTGVTHWARLPLPIGLQ